MTAGVDDKTGRPDPELVQQLRARVAERLRDRRRAEQAAGGALGPEDERELARDLIGQELGRYSEEQLLAARAPLELPAEDALAEAVHDALFRLGRLQPLLDDEQLENIDVNGPDEVWLEYADGTVVAAPAGVALAGGAAWVPAGASTTLWRVDRAANRVAGRIGLDRRLLGPVGVAARDGTVWVSCCAFQHGPRPAGMLLRVDTCRNRVVGRVMLAAGSRVEAITATPGAIWAVDTGDHNLLRLDPGSGRVGLAVAAPVPRGVGVGDGGAWAIVTNDRTLARVDEQAGRLRARVPAEVVRDVRGIAVGPGALWVTTGNEVVRLDPHRLP